MHKRWRWGRANTRKSSSSVKYSANRRVSNQRGERESSGPSHKDKGHPVLRSRVGRSAAMVSFRSLTCKDGDQNKLQASLRGTSSARRYEAHDTSFPNVVARGWLPNGGLGKTKARRMFYA